MKHPCLDRDLAATVGFLSLLWAHVLQEKGGGRGRPGAGQEGLGALRAHQTAEVRRAPDPQHKHVACCVLKGFS